VARTKTAAVRKSPANEIHKVNVSGKSYDAGVKSFKIKPVGSIKRGFGVQYKYELKLADLRTLVDLMSEIGTPEDYDKYDEAVADAIQRDLGRFPEAVQPK
jgi:hypothetical protein